MYYDRERTCCHWTAWAHVSSWAFTSNGAASYNRVVSCRRMNEDVEPGKQSVGLECSRTCNLDTGPSGTMERDASAVWTRKCVLLCSRLASNIDVTLIQRRLLSSAIQLAMYLSTRVHSLGTTMNNELCCISSRTWYM